MTTTVIVKAHCSSDKEVSISLEAGADSVETIIQDGEEHEVCAYDERAITIKEVLK